MNPQERAQEYANSVLDPRIRELIALAWLDGYFAQLDEPDSVITDQWLKEREN